MRHMPRPPIWMARSSPVLIRAWIWFGLTFSSSAAWVGVRKRCCAGTSVTGSSCVRPVVAYFDYFGVRFGPRQGGDEVPLIWECFLFSRGELVVGVGGDGHG